MGTNVTDDRTFLLQLEVSSVCERCTEHAAERQINWSCVAHILQAGNWFAIDSEIVTEDIDGTRGP